MSSHAETYLKDFHARQPGSTRRMFDYHAARSAAASYPTSYHALAARVPNDVLPRTVVDLACGDGPLLRILSERGHPATALVGIDMSEGELAAARAALPPAVRLLQERAQALSLEAASVDVLLSHMAMMLMDDIEQVIAEARRVLRQGGTFCAVVGRSFLLGEVGEVYLDVLRPLAKEHLPQLRLGDPRTRSEDGWRELLQQGFVDTRFEDIDVDWAPTPEELWQSMLETYDADRMDAATQALFKQQLLAALVPLQNGEGRLATGWGLRLVQTIKVI